jgi:AraC family L-rhamnose operon transcriptional activator RhaR/AraC family L-rhamnose operon regulatory protein RhaS
MTLALPLRIFTESEDFPFYIHYGFHEKECHMHTHADFFELVIVLAGSAEHIVGEERYLISEGDVFVIDSNTAHGYIGAKDFRICNIMFKPEIMLRDIYDIRKTAGFQALFVLEPQYASQMKFTSRLRLEHDRYLSVRSDIDVMIKEFNARQEGWQTVVYAMFVRLIAELSRLYQSSADSGHSDIMKLAAATAYIERNFCDDISVADLAQMSGYSERQFSRLFHSAFSTTPNSYITELRLEKAQLLLRTTTTSVGEISWNCGFGDQNYFSRIFRQQTGLTPTEYRRSSFALPK